MGCFRTLIAIILSAIVISGCSTRYPLNMSEEEWLQLSPAQQLDARERQAQLDLAERARRAEQAEITAQREAAERERYLELLQDARQGDVVQCVLQDAEGYFSGSWRAAEAMGFSLLREYPEQIRIAEADRATRTVEATATFSGANVKICRVNRNECVNLAATQNQLIRGVTQHIDLSRTVRGELYCDIPVSVRSRTRHE